MRPRFTSRKPGADEGCGAPEGSSGGATDLDVAPSVRLGGLRATWGQYGLVATAGLCFGEAWIVGGTEGEVFDYMTRPSAGGSGGLSPPEGGLLFVVPGGPSVPCCWLGQT